jgi:hypothetical protein
MMAACSKLASEGVKVAENVQLSPTPSVEPQVLAERAKSAALAPEGVLTTILLRVAVPLFVRVTVIGELVTPKTVTGKVTTVGDRFAAEAVAIVTLACVELELVPAELYAATT